jgi:hypothetical protein
MRRYTYPGQFDGNEGVGALDFELRDGVFELGRQLGQLMDAGEDGVVALDGFILTCPQMYVPQGIFN